MSNTESRPGSPEGSKEKFSSFKLLRPADRSLALSLVQRGVGNVLCDIAKESKAILLPYFAETTVVVRGLVLPEHPLLGIAQVAKRLRMEEGAEFSYLSATSQYFITAEAVLAEMNKKKNRGRKKKFALPLDVLGKMRQKVHEYDDIMPAQKDTLDFWSVIASFPYELRQKTLSRSNIYKPPIFRRVTHLENEVSEALALALPIKHTKLVTESLTPQGDVIFDRASLIRSLRLKG